MGKLMKINVKYHGLGVVSGVLLTGIVIGGIGGQVLAQMKGPTDMKGVSVTELGIINEESLKAQLGIEGLILRMRAVTVEPGGHILEHSHATRPGLVKMVSGTWIEGFPDGREITYRAGEDVVLPENKDTVHWIYNRGNEPATGIVCGIQSSK
jgi:quercetin dioxygenase-like cupin family protein